MKAPGLNSGPCAAVANGFRRKGIRAPQSDASAHPHILRSFLSSMRALAARIRTGHGGGGPADV